MKICITEVGKEEIIVSSGTKDMGERGLDRDLLEQTVLDRMRNKVKTLNTSPDNRGT